MTDPQAPPPERPRRAAALEVHELEDGLVIYNESTDRVHHLNSTAAAILYLCDGRRTPAGIAAEVQRLFGLDSPPDQEVLDCLEHLVRERLVRLG